MYAAAGRRDEALKIIANLTEQATRRFVDPYLFATVYGGLRETDRMYLWLEKAYESRSSFLPWIKIDPKWDHLPPDLRFVDLTRRIGLTPG